MLPALTLPLLVVGAIATILSPRESQKPLITVYMRQDCLSCQRWARTLRSHGFRTQVGREADWNTVRARFDLPVALQGQQTAVVDGLLIEGHVPAFDIRAVLAKPHAHVMGLVVPGLPPGAPGLESDFPQRFTVYVVEDSGQMRVWAVHQYELHM